MNPVTIMSLIFNSPDPNIIAFGGVATGIIKASEDARVTGTIKNKG